MNNKKMLLNILIIIPFILGFFAYLEFNPEDYLDAAYFALQNYILEYDYEERSLLLELSRWSAPFVTTSIILSVLGKIFINLRYKLILLFNKDLIAVYGSEPKTKYLIKSLDGDKKKYIVSDKAVKSSKIKHHIVMYETQEENLLFYSENMDNFNKNSHVHVWLENFSPHLLNNKNIDFYLLSLAELTAQLFWKNDCTDLNKIVASKPVVKIAMIGSGTYFEKMLGYALQINLYSKTQQIEYHIFGDLDEYKNLHYKLPRKDYDNRTELMIYPQDKIIIHNKKWYEYAEFLTTVDKIIICEPKDSDVLNIACSLKSYIPITTPLYIQINDSLLIKPDIMNGMILFGDYYKVCHYDEITNNEIIKLAKKQNDSYNTKNDVANYWANLDNFLRDSNIFSALYRNINFPNAKDDEIEEQFAELEHIRWSRFHYMHNWEYGTSKKDVINRIHPSLTDYAKLSENEKQKDIDAIKSSEN